MSTPPRPLRPTLQIHVVACLIPRFPFVVFTPSISTRTPLPARSWISILGSSILSMGFARGALAGTSVRGAGSQRVYTRLRRLLQGWAGRNVPWQGARAKLVAYVHRRLSLPCPHRARQRPRSARLAAFRSRARRVRSPRRRRGAIRSRRTCWSRAPRRSTISSPRPRVDSPEPLEARWRRVKLMLPTGS